MFRRDRKFPQFTPDKVSSICCWIFISLLSSYQSLTFCSYGWNFTLEVIFWASTKKVSSGIKVTWMLLADDESLIYKGNKTDPDLPFVKHFSHFLFYQENLCFDRQTVASLRDNYTVDFFFKNLWNFFKLYVIINGIKCFAQIKKITKISNFLLLFGYLICVGQNCNFTRTIVSKPNHVYIT